MEKTLEALGGIDIVVNNAGATKRGDFLTLNEEDWTDGFALKFFGAVRLLRAASRSPITSLANDVNDNSHSIYGFTIRVAGSTFDSL